MTTVFGFDFALRQQSKDYHAERHFCSESRKISLTFWRIVLCESAPFASNSDIPSTDPGPFLFVPLQGCPIVSPRQTIAVRARQKPHRLKRDALPPLGPDCSSSRRDLPGVSRQPLCTAVASNPRAPWSAHHSAPFLTNLRRDALVKFLNFINP